MAVLYVTQFECVFDENRVQNIVVAEEWLEPK